MNDVTRSEIESHNDKMLTRQEQIDFMRGEVDCIPDEPVFGLEGCDSLEEEFEFLNQNL